MRPQLFISLLVLQLLLLGGVSPKMIESSLYTWESRNPAVPRDDLGLGVMTGKVVIQVCTGADHTMVLTDEGNVFAWGGNQFGQVGDGTNIDRQRPVAVRIQSNITFIAAGYWHSMAVSNDGEVYVWGSNQQGQLGTNSLLDHRNLPVVVLSRNNNATQVAAGEKHSMALTRDGTLFVWGNNKEGQLGNGTTVESLIPMRNTFIDKPVKQIAAGQAHSMVLTYDGIVFTWGTPNNGQLGRFSDNRVPMAVDSAPYGMISKIAAGDQHNVVLTHDGKLYSWGLQLQGQIGDGSPPNPHMPSTSQLTPVFMDGALLRKNVTNIAAGFRHTLAITDDGEIYSWGDNQHGTLGDGTNIERRAPTAVNMNGVLRNKVAMTIAAGKENSMVVTTDGMMYSWGNNNFGKLGDATMTNRFLPVDVNTDGVLKGKTITRVATNEDHTIVLTSDNQLFSWGNNARGQLGDGSNLDREIAVSIDMGNSLQGKSILQIAVGKEHSLALTTDGMVYSWGSNLLGQLGAGISRDSPVPVPFYFQKTQGHVTNIATGGWHTVVLTSENVLYAWGGNEFGQLGDGTTVSRTVPVMVNMTGALRDQTIVQIDAGDIHTVVSTSEGKSYSWGGNEKGQLGYGSVESKINPYPAPIEIDGGKVTKIAAGAGRTVVVTSDGIVHSYGGKMPVFHRKELVDHKITHIATGDINIVLVTNNSQVYAWDLGAYLVNISSVSPNQTIFHPYAFSYTVKLGTLNWKNGFLGVSCENGYYGDTCMSYNCYNVGSTSDSVCSGRGKCVSIDTCACNKGFTGIDCAAPVCQGLSSRDKSVCSSRGICTAPDECTCNFGSYGATCSKNLRSLGYLSLLSVPLVLFPVVIVVLVGFILRRIRRDKKIESDLRACLLEEMAEFETTTDERTFFIDMKDIKLTNRLSEGASGVVFKGKWKSNAVAVKKMKVPDDTSFLKEISILQSLRHPNILYLYGYSSNDNGDKFVITEFAAGGSLDKVIYGQEPLRDFRKKVSILSQIADTMTYLHERNPRIIHRDLKPQNILLDERGDVRICDFGLSKAANTAFTIGVSYGTIEYSAPELLTRNGHDEKCDVYSFGIMMHEIFTGQHPYSRHHDGLAIFSLGIEIVSGLRPSVPFDVPSNADPSVLNQFFAQSNDDIYNSSVNVAHIVEAFYELTTSCWQDDRHKRPTFEQVATKLAQISARL